MNTTTITTADQAIEQATALVNRNTSLKNGCCLISAKVSSPCGESTLPNAIVSLNGQQINSEQVKSSKLQWFPRNQLKLTTKYSNRISRILNTYGVKLGDMTVVPLAKLNHVQAELDELHIEWKVEVDVIVSNYDSILSQHCAENKEVAHLIKEHALTGEQFKGRFKLKMLAPLALTPLNEADESEVAGEIKDNLWSEIAKEASKIYSSSWFKDHQPVTRLSQKIKRPINRLVSKLLDLSFLDESLTNVATTVADVMRSLPATGHIEKQDFECLTRWMLVMSDESKLRLHAEHSSNADAFISKVEIKSEANKLADAFIAATFEESTTLVGDEANTNTADKTPPAVNVEVAPALAPVQPETPKQPAQSDALGFGDW